MVRLRQPAIRVDHASLFAVRRSWPGGGASVNDQDLIECCAIPLHACHACQSEDHLAVCTCSDAQWAELREQLLSYAWRAVQDSDDAEDIVQVTLVRLLNQVRKTPRQAWPRSYLKRCVLNAVRDAARRRNIQATARASESPMPPHVTGPDDLLDAAFAERTLVSAIARLPARARTCYVQVELLGISIDEVARSSSVSRKAVELRLSSARRHLRSAIRA